MPVMRKQPSTVRQLWSKLMSEPLPQDILDQMRSCHNAATEFLRQYWSAILPTSALALGAKTTATSESTKSVKAEKMAGYLRLTEGKVDAVIQTARIAGADVGRVKAVSVKIE